MINKFAYILIFTILLLNGCEENNYSKSNNSTNNLDFEFKETYEGIINLTNEVKIDIQKIGNKLVGICIYKKIGKAIPLYGDIDIDGNFNLYETNHSQEITGIFTGVMSKEAIAGIWKDPKNNNIFYHFLLKAKKSDISNNYNYQHDNNNNNNNRYDIPHNQQHNQFPIKKESNYWEGEFKNTQKYSTLIINNVNVDYFDFSISIANYSCDGTVSGKAKFINDNKAYFKSDEGCYLLFIFVEFGTIQVEELESCQFYRGATCGTFSGFYASY